jgi:transposase-like protein
MAKEQKTETKELKVEAVRLVHSNEKSQAQIACDLGIGDRHPVPVVQRSGRARH